MDYIQSQVTVNPVTPYREILTALLAEIGYDSFQDTDQGVEAYIASDQFNQSQVDALFETLTEVEIAVVHELIPHHNWNETWEANYHPVIVDERCIIRALFHEPAPQYQHEIIIQPQMSFGTGHHPTTLTMMRALLDIDVDGKTLIDIGSGTGVLAILAEQKGAVKIKATDIEDHIIENARDNVRHNDCVEITVDKADMTQSSTGSYDFILANINLNTLIAGLEHIIGLANSDATVLLSGFYVDDCPTLIAEAKTHGLVHQDTKTQDRWAVLRFVYHSDS